MHMRTVMIVVCGLLVSASPSIAQVMNASWYGPGFHGKKTASGERYNMYAMTAAHKSLPFGTRLMLTNLKNGHSACVTINDRGPYIAGRQLDVSKGVAKKLGFSGVTKLNVIQGGC